METNYPTLFRKYKKQLKNILSRGEIVSENEWYLARHRLDEIEGEVGNESEVAILDKLLSKYEFST